MAAQIIGGTLLGIIGALVVRGLPADAQDDIARVVFRLAGANDEPPVPLAPEEQAAIAVSKAAASRGEFATDEQVRAVWAKHGL
jgi:hypothetical protein